MPSSKRGKVGLLFVGGSTLEGRDRAVTSVITPKDIEPWIEQISEADIIADTIGWFVASGEQPIGGQEWIKTASVIAEHYDEVDGFVVLHQLETLPAGATVLTLMLQHLGKPVVVVGSPLTAPYERTQAQTTWPTTKEYGAKASFINAIQVAISDAGEVVVVYGSHVFRGPSVLRKVEGDRSRLDGEVLGKIDFGIRFFGKQIRRQSRRIVVRPTMETRVTAIEYLPGMTVDQVLAMTGNAKGLFISSIEASRALQSVLPELQKRVTCPIGVFLPPGHSSKIGVTVPGSSRSNAVVAFMWALGQTSTNSQLKKLLASLKS